MAQVGIHPDLTPIDDPPFLRRARTLLLSSPTVLGWNGSGLPRPPIQPSRYRGVLRWDRTMAAGRPARPGVEVATSSTRSADDAAATAPAVPSSDAVFAVSAGWELDGRSTGREQDGGGGAGSERQIPLIDASDNCTMRCTG
jgi:hypothetical protein